MPVWLMQAGAVFLGLVVLGFFAFATAYYARNRRMALAARDAARASDGGRAVGGEGGGARPSGTARQQGSGPGGETSPESESGVRGREEEHDEGS